MHSDSVFVWARPKAPKNQIVVLTKLLRRTDTMMSKIDSVEGTVATAVGDAIDKKEWNSGHVNPDTFMRLLREYKDEVKGEVRAILERQQRGTQASSSESA